MIVGGSRVQVFVASQKKKSLSKKKRIFLFFFLFRSLFSLSLSLSLSRLAAERGTLSLHSIFPTSAPRPSSPSSSPRTPPRRLLEPAAATAAAIAASVVGVARGATTPLAAAASNSCCTLLLLLPRAAATARRLGRRDARRLGRQQRPRLRRGDLGVVVWSEQQEREAVLHPSFPPTTNSAFGGTGAVAAEAEVAGESTTAASALTIFLWNAKSSNTPPWEAVGW